MKKQKLVVIVLVISMLLGLLGGCSQKNDGKETGDQTNQTGDTDTNKDEWQQNLI
ncbi:MAG: hypothetical protein K0R00_3932 [Herbinix sp.]|nr:hypothetical protein [Herbinix sp.]